jgi:hypothetical protein
MPSTSFDISYNARATQFNWHFRDGLRLDIRRLPHDATATQRTALQEKRQKLAARIAKFHENADAMTGGLELDAGTVHIDDPRFCRAEGELDEGFEVQHADDDDFGWVDDEIPAEDMGLWMPSSVPSDRAAFFGLAALRAEELELRKGQATDCLEKLRLALGRKAIIYRQHFRSADSVWTGTRSKQEAQLCRLKIEKYVRCYQRARSAMRRLGIGPDPLLNGAYQDILPEQLSVDKEVTEENRFGQGSDRLAWFWRVNNAQESQKDAWMDECEWFRIGHLDS